MFIRPLREQSEHSAVIDVSKKYKFIDEVILLELTTPNIRAQFFGLDPNDELTNSIETVLKNEINEK